MAASSWLAVGTYEGGVLVFELRLGADPGRIFSPSLGLQAHNGSVRAVCVSKRFAVSASTDETLHAVGPAKGKDFGPIYQESPGVGALELVGSKHLVTGGDDGRLHIFRTSDWEELTSAAGHDAPIVDLAVHPSGRVAASVGKDDQLVIWDLMRAKSVLRRQVESQALGICWSPSGRACALLFRGALRILNVDEDRVSDEVAVDEGLGACTFVSDECLIAGLDNGTLLRWMLGSEPTRLKEAHRTRIKGLCVVNTSLVASASSDGEVKLWASQELRQVDGVETRCRITCIAAAAEGSEAAAADRATVNGKVAVKETKTAKRARATDGAQVVTKLPSKAPKAVKKKGNGPRGA